jgi:hypothetical protein
LAQATKSVPFAVDIPGIPDLLINGQNLFALSTSQLSLVRDANGNAIGGLRLPVVTVPVASYDGPACVLLGTSVPFLPAELHELYPSHADYVSKMVAATQAVVNERYMTVSDGIDLLQRACASAIPSWGTTPSSQQPAICGRLGGLFRAVSS